MAQLINLTKLLNHFLYVIFTDADTILNVNSVQFILSHYQNEKIGGVACEKRIFLSKNNSKSNYAEGLYWQYESFIKQMESEVHSVIGAAGEFFSIKTNLFQTDLRWSIGNLLPRPSRERY